MAANWTDDFNRANAATLGANYLYWSPYGAGYEPAVGITSNKAVLINGSGFPSWAIRTADAATTANQYIKVDVSDASQEFALGISVPTTYPTGIGLDGFVVQWQVGGSQIYWYINGSFAGNPSVSTLTGAHTFELRVVGTALTLYADSVSHASTTVTPLAVSGHAQQAFYSNGPDMDNAEGGNYPAGGGAADAAASPLIVGQSAALQRSYSW
jgi:hypothetical protein